MHTIHSIARLSSNVLLGVLLAQAWVQFANCPATLAQRLHNSSPLTSVVSENDHSALEKALVDNPVNARAHMMLAAYYTKQGMIKLADEEYRLAARYAPAEPHALLDLVKLAAKSGNSALAGSLAKGLETQFPDDPYILYFKGLTLLSERKFVEADKALSLAQQSSETIPGLATALASLRLTEKRYEEALHLVDSDLATSPSYYLSCAIKGTALAALEKYDEAIAPLTVAFSVNSLNPQLSGILSNCLMRRGKLEQALHPALYYLALNYGPGAKNPLITIMRSLPANKVNQAVKHVTERVNMTPFGANLHFALGDVYDRLGQRKLAMEQYREGLRLNPEFARGYLRLGEDLELYSHDYDQALACYRNAFVRQPGEQEILNRYNRLSNRLPLRKQDLAWRLKDWLTRGG